MGNGFQYFWGIGQATTLEQAPFIWQKPELTSEKSEGKGPKRRLPKTKALIPFKYFKDHQIDLGIGNL